MSASATAALVVGRVYDVDHRLGGRFVARVLDHAEAHVCVEVVEGYYRKRTGGTYGVGEQFVILKLSATFMPREGGDR